MSNELKALIEKARHRVMSPAQLESQAISFAYGNAHYENDLVTREGVARHTYTLNQARDSHEGSSR